MSEKTDVEAKRSDELLAYLDKPKNLYDKDILSLIELVRRLYADKFNEPEEPKGKKGGRKKNDSDASLDDRSN